LPAAPDPERWSGRESAENAGQETLPFATSSKWIFCILHAKIARMQAISPISRRPLHEEAVDRMRDLIVRGDLAPGSRLN
jgi:hypothetical protein